MMTMMTMMMMMMMMMMNYDENSKGSRKDGQCDFHKHPGDDIDNISFLLFFHVDNMSQEVLSIKVMNDDDEEDTDDDDDDLKGSRECSPHLDPRLSSHAGGQHYQVSIIINVFLIVVIIIIVVIITTD